MATVQVGGQTGQDRFLTGKPLGFPERLGVRCERHRRIKSDSKVPGLSNEKVSTAGQGGCEGSWLDRRCLDMQEFSWDMQSLRYLRDQHRSGDSKKAKAVSAQTLGDSFLRLTDLTSVVSHISHSPPRHPPSSVPPFPLFSQATATQAAHPSPS